MVTTTSIYNGSLRCRATHGPSGGVIVTDAPVDNHGRGEAFSPTDLVAAAVGTCILTVMGIAAERLGAVIDGAEVVVEKTMVAAPTRRIGALACRITMPAGIKEGHRASLTRAAERCPVKESLHPETEITMVWVWA